MNLQSINVSKIAYVCTNFNSSDDTIAAIESLRSGDAESTVVIVVDNASATSEREKLESYCGQDPLSTLVCSEENIGYFRGLNAGLRKLKSILSDPDLVIVGNNDLVFPGDLYESVERIAYRFENYPVVSPDIVTADGDHQNPHVIEGISRFRERIYDLVHKWYWLGIVIRFIAARSKGFARRGDEDQFEHAMEVTQGHGSCYFLGRLFFKEFEELWAPTFLFGEEYFLSLQLHKRGYRVFYDPGVTVTHAWHSSLSKVPSRHLWEIAKESHAVYRQHNPL